MIGSITALTAGVLAIIYLAMTIWVIMARVKYRIDLGHGDNKDLHMRIRAHANFAEYVPICLIVMFFVEAGGGPRWLVLAMGAALVLGRLAHVYGVGMIEKPGLGRLAGTFATNTVMLVGGVVLILRALG